MSQKSGVSLIEIIVALVVFGTGILAVLALVTHNINTSHTIATKTQATIYAKEAIELVYHIRDTNNLTLKPRNCAGKTQGGSCETPFFDQNREHNSFLIQTLIQPNLTGSFGISTFNPVDRTQDFENAQLYEHTIASTNRTGQLINHQNSINNQAGRRTNFARYISFTGVISEDGSILPYNEVLKITTTVIYHTNTTGSLILESIIGDIQ